ncbi:hypothetical protein Syun_025586 [Stephania yunnanensis]|uniref:Uncharacterized protein n=1 Tax=Stephania yunnanensis TaxID=152371 RepID=A0AAP0ERY1_9MAGN
MRGKIRATGSNCMARTKNTVNREETGVEQLKGLWAYRKSKELGRGVGPMKLSLEEEGEQLSGEKSKEESSEDKRESGEKDGGKDNSGEKSEEEIENEGEGGSGSSCDDKESGDKREEEVEEEEKEKEKEVVEVGKRVVAKGGNKAKPRTPKSKKPTDDTSTPFPKGPKN